MSNTTPPTNINNLVILSSNGQPAATSLRVAEHFQKRHDHVIRDIEKLIKKGLPNFGESNYLNKQNKKQPMYIMDRKGFTLLAMNFSGDKALDFKIQYIDAFDAMEAELMRQQEEKEKLISPEKVAQAFYDAGRELGIGHNIMRRIVIDGTQNLSGVDISGQLAPPDQTKQKLPEPIRNQLRRIRIAKNMTQSDISFEVFGSSDQYGRMERGIIPISEKDIDLILKALGSNRSELLTTTITNGVVVAGKVFNYIPRLRYFLGFISSASELSSYMARDTIQLAGWHLGCELLDICLPIKESK